MLRRFRCIAIVTVLPLILGVLPIQAGEVPTTQAIPFRVIPKRIELQRHFARTQLLVAAASADGTVNDRSDDLTHVARYTSTQPEIVRVTEGGELRAIADGTANIVVTVAGVDQLIPVTVTGLSGPADIGFTAHISPILSKAGCNMGACHASQYGKGGFKLSVFGFEPEADHDAIVRDRQQRRVNRLVPADSLFLQKPTMQVPHGGSRRLDRHSTDYEILTAWIAGGAPGPVKDPVKADRIVITPLQRIGRPGLTQQLRVVAVYPDGTQQDVTAWAKFDAMDDAVVEVSDTGLVHTVGRGQAPVMVRFEGHAALSTFVVPYAESIELASWTNNNFIDELASAKFRELGIEPSRLCDDATFLRRAFLDATGSTPTIDEIQAFLDSDDPDKRNHLIDRLLGLTGNPELDIYNDRYAAWWTLKWSDLLRNTSKDLGEQGMWALHNWIRESFRTNKPMDQFVSELVTAKGSIYMSGPANYYRVNRTATDLAESTAQLFLGVRLQCAKCHHHPFESYSQGDYYGFAAFFSRVTTKNSQEFGLFGRESVVMVRSSGEVRHPKTGRNMPPTPLEGEPVEHELDRRIPLADWLTAADNAYFARSIVNRYLSYLLGRGLVEPVDDMRATNPPSNVALMDALAKHFVECGFHSKQLIRSIMMSRLYQLDSQPTETNRTDRRLFSYFKVKRLAAEALLDAVDQVTEAPTKFKSLPPGTRAIELPDSEYPNYFLTTFAKPRRASVCECERMPDENLAQALHTLNGDILAAKIGDKNGRVARLVNAKTPYDDIVDELYLAALSRHPTGEERVACRQFLSESAGPQEFYEDLLWSLLNSKQFLFVR